MPRRYSCPHTTSCHERRVSPMHLTLQARESKDDGGNVFSWPSGCMAWRSAMPCHGWHATCGESSSFQRGLRAATLDDRSVFTVYLGGPGTSHWLTPAARANEGSQYVRASQSQVTGQDLQQPASQSPDRLEQHIFGYHRPQTQEGLQHPFQAQGIAAGAVHKDSAALVHSLLCYNLSIC